MGFGHAFEIVTTVPDRGEAAEFYERLGFRWAFGGRPSGYTEWATDGRATIVLVEGPPAPARLAILVESAEAAAKLVATAGAAVEPGPPDEGEGETSRWFSFVDPGGLDVVVFEADPAEAIPRVGEAPSLCGAFGEVSVLTPSADGSHAFWARLGFAPTWFPPAPRRVGSMSDGVLPVGFYEPGTCPHAFRSPALTYFNADNPDRLRAMKAAGWTFLEEMPGAGNGPLGHAILEAPGGLHLFLFGTDA